MARRDEMLAGWPAEYLLSIIMKCPSSIPTSMIQRAACSDTTTLGTAPRIQWPFFPHRVRRSDFFGLCSTYDLRDSTSFVMILAPNSSRWANVRHLTVTARRWPHMPTRKVRTGRSQGNGSIRSSAQSVVITEQWYLLVLLGFSLLHALHSLRIPRSSTLVFIDF